MPPENLHALYLRLQHKHSVLLRLFVGCSKARPVSPMRKEEHLLLFIFVPPWFFRPTVVEEKSNCSWHCMQWAPTCFLPQARLDRTPKDQNGVLENDVFRRSGDALSPFYVMADRTLGNFLEQAIPFLTGMWLHAVFVDARVSTALGSLFLYVCSCCRFVSERTYCITYRRLAGRSIEILVPRFF